MKRKIDLKRLGVKGSASFKGYLSVYVVLAKASHTFQLDGETYGNEEQFVIGRAKTQKFAEDIAETFLASVYEHAKPSGGAWNDQVMPFEIDVWIAVQFQFVQKDE